MPSWLVALAYSALALKLETYMIEVRPRAWIRRFDASDIIMFIHIQGSGAVPNFLTVLHLQHVFISQDAVQNLVFLGKLGDLMQLLRLLERGLVSI